MARYPAVGSELVEDDHGNPIAATIYVYDLTGALVTLTADGGGAKANPIIVGSDGLFYFNATDGVYLLEVHAGGKVKTVIVPVGIGAEAFKGDPGSPSEGFSTRAALAAALNSATSLDDFYLSEAGREGKFIYSSANLSAKVTSDPLQGMYIAKASDPTGASGAAVRVWTPGEYIASWWGVKADAAWNGTIYTGTGDTAAIQAGWNYVGAQGGGRIIYAPRPHLIDGPLLETSASNAQLILPKVLAPGIEMKLVLDCPFPAPVGQSAVGAIFCSNLTAGTGAVIGVCTSNASGVSNLDVDLSAITVRIPQNTTISGIDLSYVHSSKPGRVDVPNAFTGSGLTFHFTVAEPTHNTNYGIKGPLNGICDRMDLSAAVVVGCYWGIRISELTVAGGGAGAQVAACKTAYIAAAGSHSSCLGYTLVTSCQNTLFVDGECEINDSHFEEEHNDPAAAGPSWLPAAGAGGRIDFDDAGNHLRGKGNTWQMLEGATFPFVVNGAQNFEIKRVRREAAPVIGALFSTIIPLTNASSFFEILGQFGGRPWLSLVMDQASTTGTIGNVSFANGLTGHDNLILAQVAAACDGAVDKGLIAWATAKAGTLTQYLHLDSNGFLVFDVLPKSAANDAAAAALTPPVPVGGVYHNTTAGALRARLS
jgi:hypothetical protein